MTDKPKKPASPFASIGGIAGAIGGWAISQYCGSSIWIPGAAAVMLLVFFTKTSLGPREYKGAIAMTGGQILWFLLAVALTGQWANTLGDILLLAAALAWLWVRPGTFSAIFLGLVELVSLAANLVAISTVPIGAVAHRSLTAHCLLRILILLALSLSYAKARKRRRELKISDAQADEPI
jgi:hypothetical protein